MYLNDYEVRVKYTKLRKIIKKRRMTISAFGKRAGISRADLYLMQIDEAMSPEGEYNACRYLGLDTSDIRDLTIPDPRDANKLIYFPGDRTDAEWLTFEEPEEEPNG